MTDSLEQLLRQTDAAAPPLPGTVGLANRVIETRKRELARRRKIVGVCAVMSILSIAGEWMQRQGSVAPVAVVAPLPSSASLEITASLHQQTADLLMGERKPKPSPRLRSTIPDMRLERDRAALVLVYEADRHARDHRLPEAIAAYRRAVELFPQTHWGEIARQRLKEIQT